jgi:hypothetical protein
LNFFRPIYLRRAVASHVSSPTRNCRPDLAVLRGTRGLHRRENDGYSSDHDINACATRVASWSKVMIS